MFPRSPCSPPAPWCAQKSGRTGFIGWLLEVNRWNRWFTYCCWTWPFSSLIYPLKMMIFHSYVSVIYIYIQPYFLEHEFYDFPYTVLGMSSSQLTLTLSFFRGVDGQPPSSLRHFDGEKQTSNIMHGISDSLWWCSTKIRPWLENAFPVSQWIMMTTTANLYT